MLWLIQYQLKRQEFHSSFTFTVFPLVKVVCGVALKIISYLKVVCKLKNKYMLETTVMY